MRCIWEMFVKLWRDRFFVDRLFWGLVSIKMESKYFIYWNDGKISIFYIILMEK